jgi:hypothetical protein
VSARGTLTGVTGAEQYEERLWAPFGWWAVPTVLAVALGVAFGYPLGLPAGLVAGLVAEGLVVWVLVRTAARVEVDPTSLRAGRAVLPLDVARGVRALDAGQAALLRGRDADPRAYLLLRPWLPLAVRVDLADPRDPTPYWYVSTRHPDRLARAVAQGR